MGIIIIMIIVMTVAIIIGAASAKLQLKSDVSVLYSTRPLNEEQIAKLNDEIKQIKKEMDEKKK